MPAASAVTPIAVRNASPGRLASVPGRVRHRRLRVALTWSGSAPHGPPTARPSALVGVARHGAGHQPHRRDAVDQAVVDLGVHRDPAVGHALDQVGLPQRALPVEPGAVQAAAEVEELPDPAGARQRVVPNVVLDVELLVLLPEQLAGRLDRAVGVLAEERHDLVVARGGGLEELADEVGSRVLGLFVELQPTDVHRLVLALREQEGRRRRIDRPGLGQRDHGHTFQFVNRACPRRRRPVLTDRRWLAGGDGRRRLPPRCRRRLLRLLPLLTVATREGFRLAIGWKDVAREQRPAAASAGGATRAGVDPGPDANRGAGRVAGPAATGDDAPASTSACAATLPGASAASARSSARCAAVPS